MTSQRKQPTLKPDSPNHEKYKAAESAYLSAREKVKYSSDAQRPAAWQELDEARKTLNSFTT